MAMVTLALLASIAWPETSEAAFVRANCRGIQKFSDSQPRVKCSESSVLEDDRHLMLGHTRAEASLADARLTSSATGGQIRGVGANGGDAGAVLMDRLTITGDWQGDVEVTVRLCVAYTFAGFGESRVNAELHSYSGSAVTYANQARVRILHRGFGGATLEDVESRGAITTPEPGPRPAQSVFELSVTERVQRSNPVLTLRADLASYALPNLESLEPVLSSFAEATARLVVSLPSSLDFSSQSGVFPRAVSSGESARSTPSSDPSWGIIAASDIGSGHALRDHRRRHRAVARSDCRQQLGVDG
ncbi:MAG: hypothetical protein R3286_20430 [Gammaproteobacteria bacterium]|nr:hypothetical protein [Gammaproteobacteria bacterium]